MTMQPRTRELSPAARAAAALAAGLLAVSMLSGCLADLAVAVGQKVIEKALEPGPTRLDAEVTATQDINPDIDGKPSPVQVRIYELAADANFNRSGFFALFDNDQAALGQEMKGREEMVLKPGQQLKIEREYKEGPKFIGVIAAFQDIDNATWRAVQPVVEHETNAFDIDVRRLAVAIEIRKDN